MCELVYRIPWATLANKLNPRKEPRNFWFIAGHSEAQITKLAILQLKWRVFSWDWALNPGIWCDLQVDSIRAELNGRHSAIRCPWNAYRCVGKIPYIGIRCRILRVFTWLHLFFLCNPNPGSQESHNNHPFVLIPNRYTTVLEHQLYRQRYNYRKKVQSGFFFFLFDSFCLWVISHRDI